MSANGDPDETSYDKTGPAFGGGHSCFDKAREIRRRTGIMLGLDQHDTISELCREWGTANADEFYQRMREMGDEELKAAVEGAQKRVRRKKGAKLIPETVEVSAYA